MRGRNPRERGSRRGRADPCRRPGRWLPPRCRRLAGRGGYMGRDPPCRTARGFRAAGRRAWCPELSAREPRCCPYGRRPGPGRPDAAPVPCRCDGGRRPARRPCVGPGEDPARGRCRPGLAHDHPRRTDAEVSPCRPTGPTRAHILLMQCQLTRGAASERSASTAGAVAGTGVGRGCFFRPSPMKAPASVPTAATHPAIRSPPTSA